MSELEEKRQTLQETMKFGVALAYAIEQLVGRSASGMTYVAGRKLGKRFTEDAKKTDDPIEALEEVSRAFAKHHFLREVQPFKLKDQAELVQTNEDGDRELKLVFRECMIRQALFCYGHEQQASMCSMIHGFFSGAFETIMGKKAELEILHSGQNACLKCLRVAS